VNPAFIIISALLFFALVALACRSVGRERWWQCSWCRCYFNEGGEVSNVPPVEPITSSGVCECCRAKEIREWQLKKLLK
jgi:hypothetical protein